MTSSLAHSIVSIASKLDSVTATFSSTSARAIEASGDVEINSKAVAGGICAGILIGHRCRSRLRSLLYTKTSKGIDEATYGRYAIGHVAKSSADGILAVRAVRWEERGRRSSWNGDRAGWLMRCRSPTLQLGAGLKGLEAGCEVPRGGLAIQGLSPRSSGLTCTCVGASRGGRSRLGASGSLPLLLACGCEL